MRLTISLLLVLSLCCSSVDSQNTVFPGDANANGKVDQYDIPYIGYAFNSTGPSRIQMEDASPQGIPQPWEDEFPSGLNFIHADCSGDGVVALSDFVFWNNNFGWQDSNPQPIAFSEESVDSDNAILWNEGIDPIPVTGNGEITIPIDLVLPFDQNINGLAFTIEYTPGHFSFANYSSQESWLTLDGNGIAFHRQAPGAVDVGMTRFGNSSLTGGGSVGTMNLIIIADVVDLLETEDDTLSTYLHFKNILLLDNNFETVPITPDSLEIKVYRPQPTTSTVDIINNLQAQVFPNPNSGSFQVQSEYPFTDLILFNGLGQRIHQEFSQERRRWEPDQLSLPPGYYTIELKDTKDISRRSTLRMLVQ